MCCSKVFIRRNHYHKIEVLVFVGQIDGDKLQTQTVNPMKLWLTPNLRKKTILLSIIWWIVNIVYWSLSYLSVNMNINDYLAFSLSGLVEIPSCLVAWYAMEKWGRRWTILITMSLVGACCVANGFVPEGNTI